MRERAAPPFFEATRHAMAAEAPGAPAGVLEPVDGLVEHLQLFFLLLLVALLGLLLTRSHSRVKVRVTEVTVHELRPPPARPPAKHRREGPCAPRAELLERQAPSRAPVISREGLSPLTRHRSISSIGTMGAEVLDGLLHSACRCTRSCGQATTESRCWPGPWRQALARRRLTSSRQCLHTWGGGCVRNVAVWCIS